MEIIIVVVVAIKAVSASLEGLNEDKKGLALKCIKQQFAILLSTYFDKDFDSEVSLS
jgi:hypothetical protein